MTVSDHNAVYWQYEYDVSAKFLVPLLRAWGAFPDHAAVLDVGCAEGGGLCALHDAGAACAGFDIEESRVRNAVRLRGSRAIDFTTGNMYLENVPFTGRQFDLVTLHDVFEHLDHKPEMIAKLSGFLRREGRLLITFPPFYSAYGGHQQHLRTWFARLPFFHIVPFSTSKILLSLRGEAPHVVEEIQKLGRLKMGMRKFEQLAAAGGLRIEHMEAYIISPNHIRFGLRPLGAGPLAHIPLLREIACTGVIYLLAKT